MYIISKYDNKLLQMCITNVIYFTCHIKSIWFYYKTSKIEGTLFYQFCYFAQYLRNVSISYSIQMLISKPCNLCLYLIKEIRMLQIINDFAQKLIQLQLT